MLQKRKNRNHLASSYLASSYLAMAFALLILVNCTGGKFAASGAGEQSEISSSDTQIPGGNPNAGNSNLNSKFTCSAPTKRGSGQKSFRRLVKSELINVINDLFGQDVRIASPVNLALLSFPNESTIDIVKDLENSHSFDHISSYSSLAEAVVETIFAQAPTRERIFGACSSQTTISDDCVKTFLQNTGAKILRRLPNQNRIDEFVSAYKTIGGGQEGLKGLLTLLLQLPEFVFHYEIGSDLNPITSNGRLALTPYEVANRIAFAVTGSLPDEALFQAAKVNSLSTLNEVRSQINRLINTTKAQKHFETVLDAWLGTGTIANPSPVLAQKVGISADGFKSESRQELMDYALYMVFNQNADLKTFLSARVGFPKSERMAKIYGSQVSSGAPVDLPNGHGGLLLRSSVLVTSALASSPILRGVAVRKRIFCESLPSPDFSIVNSRTEDLNNQDTTQLSNREVAAVITASAQCSGCHTLINPIGFALEGFDSLGMARTVETVFNPDGSVKKTHPLNTVVESPNLEMGGPTKLNDANDLLEAVATSWKARACVAERFFASSRVRPINEDDNCAVSEVENSLKSGLPVKEAWINSIANEDIFWRRGSL